MTDLIQRKKREWEKKTCGMHEQNFHRNEIYDEISHFPCRLGSHPWKKMSLSSNIIVFLQEATAKISKILSQKICFSPSLTHLIGSQKKVPNETCSSVRVHSHLRIFSFCSNFFIRKKKRTRTYETSNKLGTWIRFLNLCTYPNSKIINKHIKHPFTHIFV